VSVLFFHFLANLLDFSDPNDVCSTRAILSWQQQFVAPANFTRTNSPNHSGKRTHAHARTHARTHALGFKRSPQDARVAQAPTAHKYTTQSCIHFPNWIALYRTSGLPAGNNYRAPPSLASLRPTACKLSAIQSCFQRSMVLLDSN
jgi:hypothetical protein